MERKICITVCREEGKFLIVVHRLPETPGSIRINNPFRFNYYDGEVRWNKKIKILKHQKYFDNHKRFHSIVCL
jgi:hypothetical protein